MRVAAVAAALAAAALRLVLVLLDALDHVASCIPSSLRPSRR